jgi:prepilin-type N-terminal cleavage/methylation domain-containing protein
MAGGAVNVAARTAVRRRRGSRGFTLIELLITLSVTTIGLIGLLSLHLSIARGNDGASRSAEAEQITATNLETLRAMDITPMLNLISTQPTLTATGRNGLTYSVARSSTVLTSASTSLVRVRVVTSWTEDGAVAGANGGQLDHAIALEVIRTMEEKL